MAGSEFGGGACVIVPNGNGFYLHPVDNQLSGRVRATRARTGYGRPHREKLPALGSPSLLDFRVPSPGNECPGRRQRASFSTGQRVPLLPRKSCLHFMIHVWSMMCPPLPHVKFQPRPISGSRPPEIHGAAPAANRLGDLGLQALLSCPEPGSGGGRGFPENATTRPRGTDCAMQPS